MELMAEKLLDTLYLQIISNIDDDTCVRCPIVRAVRDLKEALRDANAERVMLELGLSFRAMECPCNKKK